MAVRYAGGGYPERDRQKGLDQRSRYVRAGHRAVSYLSIDGITEGQDGERRLG